jgi:hypothetical protein
MASAAKSHGAPLAVRPPQSREPGTGRSIGRSRRERSVRRTTIWPLHSVENWRPRRTGGDHSEGSRALFHARDPGQPHASFVDDDGHHPENSGHARDTRHAGDAGHACNARNAGHAWHARNAGHARNARIARHTYDARHGAPKGSAGAKATENPATAESATALSRTPTLPRAPAVFERAIACGLQSAGGRLCRRFTKSFAVSTVTAASRQ